MKPFPTTTLMFLCLSVAAFPQSKFCIGGELEKLTPTEVSACKAKAASLQREVRLVGAPDNWHYVLICDEAGWNDYAAFTGTAHAAMLDKAEVTDKDMRFTFVRGSRVSDSWQSLQWVLASAKKEMPQGGEAKQRTVFTPAVARPTSMMAHMNRPIPGAE